VSLRVVSLGDSISCGEGVGLLVEPARTWPALLCRALPNAELLALATAGARVRDVRAVQLPRAVAAEPHLATLLIGLNDVSRADFTPPAFADDLRAVVAALRPCGATVLLGRLHDPCAVVPLPGQLRDRLRLRVDSVNATVDEVARDPDVHLLDLADIPALRLRRAWAVDRVHPHESTHGILAAAAATALRDAGLPVAAVPPSPLPDSAPRASAEARWVIRHGTPWMAGHLRQVALPALSLALGRG
jgi:lysophospholipase L1-like esterase